MQSGLDLEVGLISHLTNVDNIKYVYEEGLKSVTFVNPINKAIFENVIQYWIDNSMQLAPTASVIEHEFPTFIYNQPEESLNWLVGQLKKRYVRNQVQDTVRSAAKVAGENPEQALNEMFQASANVISNTSPRRSRSNLAENVEDRRQRYHDRESFTGSVRGIPMGLDLVDNHTFGLLPGELGVIVGYAKTGKCLDFEDDMRLADGSIVPVSSLIEKSFMVTSIDPVTGITSESMAFAEDNGIKDVVRITTDRGRVITRTLNHPLWAAFNDRKKGYTHHPKPRWIDAGDLVPGSIVALSGINTGTEFLSEDDATILGGILTDGSISSRSIVGFTQMDGPMLDAYRSAVESYGCELSPAGKYGYNAVKKERGWQKNPIQQLLQNWGIQHKNSFEKALPDFVWRLDEKSISTLLNRMYSCDGWAFSRIDSQGTIRGEVGYCSVNRELSVGVQSLLLRLGIAADLHIRKTAWTHKGIRKTGFAYDVTMRDRENITRFINRVGILGKEAALEKLSIGYANTKKQIANWRFADIPEGMIWEKIKSVEVIENRPTVIISVPGPHTFVTDFVEHNSMSLAWTAKSAREAGYTPILFTLELAVPEFEDRMDGVFSGLSLEKISKGTLDRDEVKVLRETQDRMHDLGPLYIEKPPRGEASVKHLVSRARQVGADVIIIDQLSFIESQRSFGEKRDAFSEIMFDLKRDISDSRGTQLPCFIAAQFNREAAKLGTKKRGQMHHIGVSSAIEQTADIIYGLTQTPEMRLNKSLVMDIMAFRRGAPKSYLLEWALSDRTHIGVRKEEEIDQ